jgi:hypothetical protein
MLAILLALLGPPALPPEPTIERVPLTLDWNAEPGCPSRDELAAMLASLLPSLPAIPASEGALGRIAATGRVTTRASAWHVELEIASERGIERRGFAAETCMIAAEATALVIAVVIDPVELASREPTAEPDPDPDPDPEIAIEAATIEPTNPKPANPEPRHFTRHPTKGRDETVRVHLDPPDPEPSRPSRARGGVALRGGGGFGPLRAGSGQLELRLAAFGRGWRWEARAAWLPPVQLELDSGQRARFDGWLLGTRGCGVPTRDRFEFPLCIGIEAGQLRGEGRTSVPNPVRATQPWLAIELGPALAWTPIPNLAIGLELDAVIPLIAAGFSIDGDPILRTTPIGVRALVGLEVRFP